MAKKIKEEKTERHIKDFSNYKIIHKLRKFHSPLTIAFLEDPEDSWFIQITYYKTKSGIITDTETIIAKDLNIFLTHLKRLGWKEK